MNGTMISGVGAALPAAKTLSETLDIELGKKRGWLYRRTGVKARYICEGETQEGLAAEAARHALDNAGLSIEDIGLVLFGAAVGRQPIPATAPLILKLLGGGDHIVPAFDINATCLSALQAMDIADLWIGGGRCQHVLVVSAEIASRALPWDTQPEVAGLFGDGAAAVVLSASDDKTRGVRSFMLETYPTVMRLASYQRAERGLIFTMTKRHLASALCLKWTENFCIKSAQNICQVSSTVC